jgi:hypothetical protein
MALVTFKVTLTGGTDSLIGAASSANGAQMVDKGIRQMIISNPAGNGTLSYGTAPGGVFTTTPATLAAGATLGVIGPFSNSAPTRLSEWYFKGTGTNVITVALITH